MQEPIPLNPTNPEFYRKPEPREDRTSLKITDKPGLKNVPDALDPIKLAYYRRPKHLDKLPPSNLESTSLVKSTAQVQEGEDPTQLVTDATKPTLVAAENGPSGVKKLEEEKSTSLIDENLVFNDDKIRLKLLVDKYLEQRRQTVSELDQKGHDYPYPANMQIKNIFEIIKLVDKHREKLVPEYLLAEYRDPELLNDLRTVAAYNTPKNPTHYYSRLPAEYDQDAMERVLQFAINPLVCGFERPSQLMSEITKNKIETIKGLTSNKLLGVEDKYWAKGSLIEVPKNTQEAQLIYNYHVNSIYKTPKSRLLAQIDGSLTHLEISDAERTKFLGDLNPLSLKPSGPNGEVTDDDLTTLRSLQEKVQAYTQGITRALEISSLLEKLPKPSRFRIGGQPNLSVQITQSTTLIEDEKKKLLDYLTSSDRTQLDAMMQHYKDRDYSVKTLIGENTNLGNMVARLTKIREEWPKGNKIRVMLPFFVSSIAEEQEFQPKKEWEFKLRTDILGDLEKPDNDSEEPDKLINKEIKDRCISLIERFPNLKAAWRPMMLEIDAPLNTFLDWVILGTILDDDQEVLNMLEQNFVQGSTDKPEQRAYVALGYILGRKITSPDTSIDLGKLSDRFGKFKIEEIQSIVQMFIDELKTEPK